MQLFTNLKAKAKFLNAQLYFDDSHVDVDNLIIEETRIVLKPVPNTTYILFEADPQWDHGLHTSIEDFREQMKQRFKLVKYIKW